MDKIVFVNIEPEQKLEIHNYQVKPEIPLPILRSELNRIVKAKELPWPAFVRGIIHVFANNPKYKHTEEYKKFIYAYDPRIEERLLAEGAHLAGDGKLDTALLIFRGLVNLNPNSKEARFNLGLAFQDLSAKNSKQNPELAYNLATNAITAFETLVNNDQAAAIVYYNLGFLYRQRGLLAQAKDVWEKALTAGIDQDRANELNKLIHELDRLDIVEAQFENGITAINEGRFKVGITLLEPLGKRYPHWWQVSFQLGMAYRNIEEYEKAIEFFDKTITSNPAMPEVYSQKALCHYALKNMEEAEVLLHKALSLQPDDTGYLGNLGLVYLKQKRYDEAAGMFYQAKQITPDDALILHYIQELPSAYQRENV